ncbi:MAG: hypothetical protein ACOYEU_10140 [Limnochordia bacterium]|jgi:hypothetical protein
MQPGLADSARPGFYQIPEGILEMNYLKFYCFWGVERCLKA